jgi:predicted NAD/FAD-dependent oxidoreductase
MTSGDRLPVIVVGAGLAGLTCARLLAQTNTPVVVLGADGDSSARLTGLDVPRSELGSATLYLAARQQPYIQKLLVLNALPTPRSQFSQLPLAHTQRQLPSTRTRWPGLYLAGDTTEDSSINGAIRSGEAAARTVADDFRA